MVEPINPAILHITYKQIAILGNFATL